MVVVRVVCSIHSGKRLFHPRFLFCRPRESSLTSRIKSRSLTAVIPCQSHYTQQQQQQIKRDSFVLQGTIPSMCKGSNMELRVGQYAELHRKYTQADVNAFCEVSGDYNPVHSSRPVCDNSNNTKAHEYNTVHQQLKSSKSIVHGVLLTSIFSTVFGTLIPGCMYRSQSFKFYHPVYVDEEVFGRVIVTRLRQIINTRDSNDDDNNSNGSGMLCKCDTTIYKKVLPCSINSNEEIEAILCIDGEAQVWIPNSALKDD